MKTTTRLGAVVAISTAFFCVEISLGFRTKSLALIADAFHYLNDIVAYVIAFLAAYLQEKGHSPTGFTYAFHRGELVGAFFNATFLLALALSIALQSLERFISPQVVRNPIQVLIVGCVGLALNILSVMFLHGDHGHSHGHGHSHDMHSNNQEFSLEPIDEDNIHALHNHVRLPPKPPSSRNLGLLGVLVHLAGDAVNNIGVIIAALLMLKLHSPKRFYADPATSLFISMVIFASAIPLGKRTARILLEAAPDHLDLDHIKDDLLMIPGVLSIHDLHVWHLSQSVILASLHVQTSENTLEGWASIETELRECLSAYGVKHVTVAPEVRSSQPSTAEQSSEGGPGQNASGCDKHGAGCGAQVELRVGQRISASRNRHEGPGEV